MLTYLRARLEFLPILIWLVCLGLIVSLAYGGKRHHHVQPQGGVIDIANGNWTCNAPQDGTVVVVHNATKADGVTPFDGIHLGNGCTGTIASLTVEHTREDGIKVGDGAHDLTILGGSVNCDPKNGIVHQDGVQAMGGERITFHDFTVYCPTGNNGGFWVEVNKDVRGPVPTDVVCDGCNLLEKNAAVHIGPDSVRSGARNSTLHESTGGSAPADGCTRIDAGAVDPVHENNICVP